MPRGREQVTGAAASSGRGRAGCTVDQSPVLHAQSRMHGRGGWLDALTGLWGGACRSRILWHRASCARWARIFTTWSARMAPRLALTPTRGTPALQRTTTTSSLTVPCWVPRHRASGSTGVLGPGFAAVVRLGGRGWRCNQRWAPRGVVILCPCLQQVFCASVWGAESASVRPRRGQQAPAEPKRASHD